MKAEEIIRKEKYNELKNLVLICEAMEEFAEDYHQHKLTLYGVVVRLLMIKKK